MVGCHDVDVDFGLGLLGYDYDDDYDWLLSLLLLLPSLYLGISNQVGATRLVDSELILKEGGGMIM